MKNENRLLWYVIGHFTLQLQDDVYLVRFSALLSSGKAIFILINSWQIILHVVLHSNIL